jgi:hypothetical protein
MITRVIQKLLTISSPPLAEGDNGEGEDMGPRRIEMSALSPRIGLYITLLAISLPSGWASPPSIAFHRDESAGRLAVIIDQREAFVYKYDKTLDLPHYWPLNSPAGKSMLVEQTKPYPHHRAFWFADTVRLNGGREVSFYNAFYSGKKTGENAYSPPYRDHIRHVKLTRLKAKGNRAFIDAELVWEMDERQPVLLENRRLTVEALGGGEYFLDLTYTLTAAYGDVEFVSDEVHYAWPFLRLETRWSGDGGGILISDTGAVGEEATNLKAARWLDYSNTVEGETAGIAVFQWPDGREHRWLTRKYGCVGPRRPDDQSGKPFFLKKASTISQRVGVLVHQGDVNSGRVAERHKIYVEGTAR